MHARREDENSQRKQNEETLHTCDVNHGNIGNCIQKPLCLLFDYTE